MGSLAPDTISMGMARNRSLRVWLGLAAVAGCALLSCTREPEQQPLVLPEGDRLAATANAVGIPYDRVVVVCHRDRLIALTLGSDSQLGDRVSYHWVVADDRSLFRDAERLDQGDGETVESPHTGRIALPDRLNLNWSRGSGGFGWLYWPERVDGFAVYSRAFATVADVADGPHGGRWLTREMFQD